MVCKDVGNCEKGVGEVGLNKRRYLISFGASSSSYLFFSFLLIVSLTTRKRRESPTTTPHTAPAIMLMFCASIVQKKKQILWWTRVGVRFWSTLQVPALGIAQGRTLEFIFQVCLHTGVEPVYLQLKLAGSKAITSAKVKPRVLCLQLWGRVELKRENPLLRAQKYRKYRDRAAHMWNTAPGSTPEAEECLIY